MHREKPGEGGFVECILYGFNLDCLFFRFDYLKGLRPFKDQWSFNVNFLHPIQVKVHGEVKYKRSHATLNGGKGEIQIASEDVVELGIPFKTLGVKGGDEARVFIEIEDGVRGFERWPAKGFLIIDIPSEDFERENWMV
jgi:hypothetical protein